MNWFILRLLLVVVAFSIFNLGISDAGHSSKAPAHQAVVGDHFQENRVDGDRLVYADFDQPLSKGLAPISNRGGLIKLTAYQESPARASHYKGAEKIDPPAPELVRLQKDSPNRAATFDFELQSPNQFAGVGVEIHGQPDQGGKPVADDVSKFQYLSLQVYATGVPSLRVEFVSQGQGIQIPIGQPQMTFKITPGFNTYRIPLKSLTQPFWAPVKVSPKEVLKKLTSITLYVSCMPCAPVKGTVVVDNIVFHK